MVTKLYKCKMTEDNKFLEFEAVTRREALESICAHTDPLTVIKVLTKEIKRTMSKDNWTKKEISTGIESFIGSFRDELNKAGE